MSALPPSGAARRTAITQLIGFIALPVVCILVALVLFLVK